MIIFAGVNGSGKSTLYRGFECSSKYTYLNADSIALELGDQNDPTIQLNAGKVFISNLKKLLEEDNSIIIESTFSGKSLFKYIKSAVIKGYKISMHYIMTDINTSIERIEYRISQGGHGIPLNVINRRYSKSFDNLYANYKLFDEIYFYSNIKKNHEIIAYYNNKLDVIDKDSIWIEDLCKYIK